MRIVYVNIVFCLCALISIRDTKGKHHWYKHRNNQRTSTIYRRSPYLSIDDYGNCYANNGVLLHGLCMRYEECFSAVRNWKERQMQPLTCYYNTYEHFVCCLDVIFQQYLNDQPSSYLPLQSPTPVPLTQFQWSYEINKVKSISDKECTNIYFRVEKRKKLRRSKRITENINSNDTESAVEDVITKKSQTQTEVVAGLRTRKDEFPFMCALGWRLSKTNSRRRIIYNCGCVLIAKKYVLTAAHCAVISGEPPSVVRLGGVDLDDRYGEMINIKRIVVYPTYDKETAYDDIAVIKLDDESSFYKTEEKLKDGIGAGQICAGDPDGKMDTCQGDSGGPLLMRIQQHNTLVSYVVGLTSFGEGCANGTPSIYTRIYNYLEWIENIVWK